MYSMLYTNMLLLHIQLIFIVINVGLDTKSAECQRFIKEGMTISYNKILLDDAVSTWKFEIHVGTLALVKVCVEDFDKKNLVA